MRLYTYVCVCVASVHQWPLRPVFNPSLSHTKVLKNGTRWFLAKPSALEGTDQE